MGVLEQDDLSTQSVMGKRKSPFDSLISRSKTKCVRVCVWCAHIWGTCPLIYHLIYLHYKFTKVHSKLWLLSANKLLSAYAELISLHSL